MATRTHAITLIPGDGIGPEVSAAVVRIVEAAGKKVNGGGLIAARFVSAFEFEVHRARLLQVQRLATKLRL